MVESFIINPPRRRKRGSKRKKARRGGRRKMTALQLQYFGTRRSGKRRVNPRRKRRYGRKRRSNVYGNAWRGHRKAHAAAARKGWTKRRRTHSRKVTRSRKRNPYSNRRRRRYSNPALNLRRALPVQKIVPLAVTAIVAGSVAKMAPAFLNLQNKWLRLGASLGVAAVGAQVVSRTKMLGKDHGLVWLVGASAVVVGSLLNEFVVPYLPAQFAQFLSDDSVPTPYYVGAYEDEEMGVFPPGSAALGAYASDPYTVGGLWNESAWAQDSYPYAGTPYGN